MGGGARWGVGWGGGSGSSWSGGSGQRRQPRCAWAAAMRNRASAAAGRSACTQPGGGEGEASARCVPANRENILAAWPAQRPIQQRPPRHSQAMPVKMAWTYWKTRQGMMTHSRGLSSGHSSFTSAQTRRPSMRQPQPTRRKKPAGWWQVQRAISRPPGAVRLCQGQARGGATGSRRRSSGGGGGGGGEWVAAHLAAASRAAPAPSGRCRCAAGCRPGAPASTLPPARP